MKRATLLVAVLLAACAKDAEPTDADVSDVKTLEETADREPPKVSETRSQFVEDDSAIAKCPVIESRDWTAWIDAEPPGPARLHIRGQVDLPTPGYTASWRMGIADRAMPPGVRFHLDLAPPTGMVAQVITTEDVEYKADSAYPAYRVIYVLCGEETLAVIEVIPRAE